MTHDWLRGKNVVVTGAAGFIGSHLVDKLLANDADVIGIDNFLTGREINMARARDNARFHFIEADVTKPVESYLNGVSQIDAVFHLASPASPPRYQANPVETYQVNSHATHLFLEYLRAKHPQARFLFASTSEVYGDPEVHPQPETYWGNVNPNGPRSCYDEAKRLGETICGVFATQGMDTRIIRIFNTYGPRIDPDDGRVIPNFLKQALAGQALTIYGEGDQTRSYCYVDDLVEGILAMQCHPDAAGETVNLGNPDEYTVLETAQQIATVAGMANPDFDYQPLPKDDPTRRKPDISKAKALLGWEPTTTFSNGLQQTMEYFQANEV